MGTQKGLAAYLRARVADAQGASGDAAADYARALAGAPGSPVVAIRAYRQALETGDDALARRAAAVLSRAGVAPADVPLLALADAARAGDPVAAERATARLSAGPLRVLAPALAGWIAFARGGGVAAASPSTVSDPVARRLAAETRALLLLTGSDVTPGIAAVQALAGPAAPVDLRLAAGELLFGSGHGEEARALLAGEGPALTAARTGLAARPGLAFGVSRLLTRLAVDLSSGTPSPLVIALCRAALTADPDYGRARLLLANALARSGSAAQALAVLDAIPEGDALAPLAAATRVSILAGSGREAEALAAARTRAEAEGAGTDDWQRYADLLLAADRPDEAARFYRKLVDATPGEWVAWMQYGGALDAAGRWGEAEPALVKAVALSPDQPLALNYLGYARIAHGKDIAASTRLLERAVALAPKNSSIADSLGWAYYLAGDTRRALPLLEGAVADQPANAEVGEHLGDAYWTLGRRYEARYAWRAAMLDTDAAPAVGARLADKIARGLPAR